MFTDKWGRPMGKEWNIQQLKNRIASGARQLVLVGAILMVVALSSSWMQQWLSSVALLVVLLPLILFILIKLIQLIRWQQRIHEIMNEK